MRLCVGVVIGTRPEVIKLIPVIDRLHDAGWSRVVLLPSGQHGHLLRQALAQYGLDQLEVPPPPTTNHPAELVDILAERLRTSMAHCRPDIVLVQGDTATALAGARIAAELGIPVAHVEAGLRTYDLDQPFPEESNRQAISRLASLHFAPTAGAAANLIRESIPAASVFVTGNTIVDALARTVPDSSVEPADRPIAVVTLHRRELAPHVERVVSGLQDVLEDHDELHMVIPVHPNPAISATLRSAFGTHDRVDIVAPLPHARFVSLLRKAAVVITDSGGVQEEAAILGVPLVVARRVTERPEVLEGSRAIMAGYDSNSIRMAVNRALRMSPNRDRNELLGDGHAAVHIERCLQTFCSIHCR